MLLISCPWCGQRNEDEFHYGGAAHVPYPPDPYALDDDQWGRYLFYRANPKGRFNERWSHAAGCRKWFNAVRDTATGEVFTTYVGAAPTTNAEANAQANAVSNSVSNAEANAGSNAEANAGSSSVAVTAAEPRP